MILVVVQWSSGINARITNYKYCLYECGTCVVLWGDELYDGKRCAKCCQYSNGLKMDPECKVWVKNRIVYDKKDQDYVDRILSSQKRSDLLDYKTIFAQDEVPSYCFGK